MLKFIKTEQLSHYSSTSKLNLFITRYIFEDKENLYKLIEFYDDVTYRTSITFDTHKKTKGENMYSAKSSKETRRKLIEIYKKMKGEVAS